jgi:hypothetical protein
MSFCWSFKFKLRNLAKRMTQNTKHSGFIFFWKMGTKLESLTLDQCFSKYSLLTTGGPRRSAGGFERESKASTTMWDTQRMQNTSIHNWLTNSMGKNRRVHHRTHKSPPPLSILSQSNPDHTPRLSPQDPWLVEAPNIPCTKSRAYFLFLGYAQESVLLLGCV